MTDKTNGTAEDISSELFENPTEFLSNFAAKIKREVTEELTASYGRDKAQNEYWRGFENHRPDLKAHAAEARAALEKNFEKWVKEDLTVGETYDRLAHELDDAALVRDARKRAGDGPQSGQIHLSRKAVACP